jgi:hypothetical protein
MVATTVLLENICKKEGFNTYRGKKDVEKYLSRTQKSKGHLENEKLLHCPILLEELEKGLIIKNPNIVFILVEKGKPCQ